MRRPAGRPACLYRKWMTLHFARKHTHILEKVRVHARVCVSTILRICAAEPVEPSREPSSVFCAGCMLPELLDIMR